MEILRTPDERFADLPGFAFNACYIDNLAAARGCRIHYLDEGPSDADTTWLCLHGEPTWSYLYRKMIPEFVAAGHRVIAPDFAGFGKSDKPVDDNAYTFNFHRDMLLELIDLLDLRNIRLVCQDWGGLLGLTLPMARPDAFNALLVMNTAFSTGDVPLGDGFLAWREFVSSHPDLDVAKLMRQTTPILSDAEAAAYAAPFPDQRYKAGVRRFPQMVAEHTDADGAGISRRARDWFREQWQGQTLMAIGMKDPVLGPPAMHYLRSQIRNCPEPLQIEDAGHFVQEWGQAIARQALAAFDGPAC